MKAGVEQINQGVADRLRLLRLEAGLQFVQLAERVGIASNTIRRAEAGGPTKPEKLERLDSFFGGKLLQGHIPAPLLRRIPNGTYHTDGEFYQGHCTSRLQDGTICGEPCHRRTDGQPDRCVHCDAMWTIPESAQADARRAKASDRQAEYRERWLQKLQKKKLAQREATL